MRRGRWLLGAIFILWAVPSWAQEEPETSEPAAEAPERDEPAGEDGQAGEGGQGQAATAQARGRTEHGQCMISHDTDILADPDHEQPRQPEGASREDEDAPWSETQDAVASPDFLETEDRRIEDSRPPPTAEQLRALREMESEVERFANYGEAYRETVLSLLRREYLRQRRGRTQWYARQIQEEERLLDEARARAIRLFERFIRTYPDDPTYTPDAMFRLGELYFERSAIQFQQAYDRARETGGEAPLSADFMPTIELYKRLVRNFPDYRRLDGVYYLIGYTLNEMGEVDQARMAWLNLVCGNKFDYDPDAMPDGEELSEEEQEQQQQEEEHPSLTMDDEGGMPESDEAFKNPYEGCEPIVPDARFVSETWFRIGEYHFDDYGDPHSLDLSISAYGKILEDREDRNYSLALYKVAWAYYRASRYPEAI
ncbi:MAG: tetratricopeptide repeat protein, partial [Myxococcota bacterium]